MTKIYVLTKPEDEEFRTYQNASVYFITENKEAAEILSTAGYTLEEWALVTLGEAKEVKERYERMKAHEREEKELEEKLNR